MLVAALVVVLSACGGTASSFDPTGPCQADGQRPGAYPDLEALIPTTFDGRTPTRLDSGRNCSSKALGSLAADGISDVRFAGGLWERGQRSGFTMAVFRAPGLTVDRMARFYETGAKSASKTENVTRAAVTIGGSTGTQVETLNDESFQSIVVFASDQPDTVRVVLVGSDVRESPGIAAHRALVEKVSRTFAGGPG